MHMLCYFEPLGHKKINSSLFKNRSKIRNKLLDNATFLIYFTKLQFSESSFFHAETSQDSLWNFVIFLAVYNGNIEAAASVFGQQVAIDTFFFFAIPFELHAVKLWQLKRLHVAL